MAQILSDALFAVLRKETTWGTYDSGGTDIAHPLYDGSLGLGIQAPARRQPHVDGSVSSAFVVQDSKDLTGPMEVGLWPDLAKDLLDWATVRDSAGQGEFYSIDLVHPSMIDRRFLGVMVNSLAISLADGQDVRMAFDLRGKYESAYTPIPTRASFTWPSITSLTFGNFYALISIDGAGTEIVPLGFENANLTVNNNLTPGTYKENRLTSDLDKAIDSLTSGIQAVTGSVVVKLDSADYFTMVRETLTASIRIMGAHRAAAYATVDAAGASAGSGVAIPVTADPQTDFAIGDVVRMDTATAANVSVGVVSAVSATTITITTLDKDVVSGDRIYNDAIELYIPSARVTAMPTDQTKGQPVKVTLNVEAADESGTGAWTYHAKA